MFKFLTISCFIISLLSLSEGISKENKPNVLFILVDDLGWLDVGYQGSKFYQTPNIDSLSNKGIKFINSYSTHPRCVPSRYGIMTGRYPARTKSPGPGSQLDKSEVTIAEALKEVGYSTFIAGKWHLSRGDRGSSPEDQGFDINFGGGDSGVPKSYFYPYNIQTRGKGNENAPDITKLPKVEKGYHITDQLTDLTVEHINEYNKQNPFFIYLSYYAVHTPFESTEELEKKYEKKVIKMYGTENVDEFSYEGSTGETKLRQDNPIYAGMIENMDTNLGRVIRALKAKGFYDNTIIVFSSDHGGLSNRGNGRPLATSNLPLRAGKGHNYEGGIRIPTFFVWKNKIKPGWSNTIITGTDYYPTLLELIKTKQKPDQHLDGLSFAKSLFGKKPKNKKRPIFWHSPRPRPKSTGDLANTAVRLGNYKLLDFYREGRVELYNIAEDEGETNDLSEIMIEKKNQLLNLVKEWRISVDAIE